MEDRRKSTDKREFYALRKKVNEDYMVNLSKKYDEMNDDYSKGKALLSSTTKLQYERTNASNF
jgi:hypothetical protein